MIMEINTKCLSEKQTGKTLKLGLVCLDIFGIELDLKHLL